MRRQSGMTLVEMIVALAITALVVGFSTRCLTLASDMRASIESNRVGMDRVFIAQQLLRRVLHELEPQAGEGAPDDLRPRLHGQLDALEIEAPHPTRGPADGTYRIRVEFVDTDGARGTLVLRLGPTDQGDGTEGADEIELCRNLAPPVFEYLGESGWRNEWSETDLPQLVRIGASGTFDATPCWPELVIAPRVNGRPRSPEPRA